MSVQVVEAVREAGVVGAGGAGFPTHIKLAARAEIVIANGAECEPLLCANQELMKDRAEGVIEGLRRAMEATGAAKGIIALKGKYSECIEALTQALDKTKASDKESRIELFRLDNFYPAGDEHVLVKEVTGRTIPEAGLPLDVGVVVQNVETLYNIGRAAQGRPVTDKMVTVAGAVRQPVTLRAPLGTPAAELLKAAGGPTVDSYILIDGGPMMGKVIQEESPVIKTTSGLLVIPRDTPAATGKTANWSVMLARARAACCQCRYCTDLCPRYLLGHSLEPHRIMRAVANGIGDVQALTSALLCSECGLCETAACPMGLSPRRVNAELKKILAQKGVRYARREVGREREEERRSRRFPAKKLLLRLGMGEHDLYAPYREVNLVPERVVLPLKQHAGKAAVPVVKVGQEVKAGDLLADIPENSLGARLHSSIDGRIADISEEAIVVVR
ncbi:MAG: 4Fe-4S dicluster domain-containing protein [Moorellaceae bacterium]